MSKNVKSSISKQTLSRLRIASFLYIFAFILIPIAVPLYLIVSIGTLYLLLRSEKELSQNIKHFRLDYGLVIILTVLLIITIIYYGYAYLSKNGSFPAILLIILHVLLTDFFVSFVFLRIGSYLNNDLVKIGGALFFLIEPIGSILVFAGFNNIVKNKK